MCHHYPSCTALLAMVNNQISCILLVYNHRTHQRNRTLCCSDHQTSEQRSEQCERIATSGARYSGVPQKVFMVAPSVMPSLHRPKSVILMCPSLSSMRFSSWEDDKDKNQVNILKSSFFMKKHNMVLRNGHPPPHTPHPFDYFSLGGGLSQKLYEVRFGEDAPTFRSL